MVALGKAKDNSALYDSYYNFIKGQDVALMVQYNNPEFSMILEQGMFKVIEFLWKDLLKQQYATATKDPINFVNINPGYSKL